MNSFTGVFLFALLILMTGCGSLQQPSTAQQARAAQQRGDWAAAVPLLTQAIEERKGFWKEPFAEQPPARFVVLYYERGRSEGVICQWEAAASDLNHALELDEKSRGPVWMDLTELARMFHAQGNNILAETYFDLLFNGMPETQMARQDPQGFVATFEEAAEVAAALGKAEKSAQFRSKAASVRSAHPKLTLPTDWTPYGQACGNK